MSNHAAFAPQAEGRGCKGDQASTLTLYTRAGCPLCEEMEAAVEALLGGRAVEVARVDVDADAATQARFGWDVPLLFDGEIEIARHRLDPAAFRAWLAGTA